MINFIIWIIVGAVIGWVASLIMRTNSRQGLIADIIVGIVGAFIGGYFLSPSSTSARSTRATSASLLEKKMIHFIMHQRRKYGWAEIRYPHANK